MEPTSTITPRSEFIAGLRAVSPMILGGIPFGIVFGAAGILSDLSVWGTLGFSLFVFAGSAQFIAVGLINEGLTMGFIILTTFVVNLRHALYAASLAPYMKHLPQRWLIPSGFLLTDEAYAATITRWQTEGTNPYSHWYYLGTALGMYVSWQLCTVIGVVAGQQIPNAESWGLDFAMLVTFIGLVVPLINRKPMVVSVLVAGVVAILTNGLPNKLGLIVAAIAGIVAGMLAELIWPPTDDLSSPPIPESSPTG